MIAIFRVDASFTTGTGHVMRCITLAERFRNNDVKVEFICREMSGNLCAFIEEKGYVVHRLKYDNMYDLVWLTDALLTENILKTKLQQADWLIVDHYGLDYRWESIVRNKVKCLTVIDDLANRNHNCDILLDQNYYLEYEHRYETCVSDKCLKLLGPQYIILRDEFYDARLSMMPRCGLLNNIMISFGGSDPTNETLKTMRAVQLLNNDQLHMDVVIGISHSHIDEIKKLCDSYNNATFHCQVNNMAELMIKADLSIGAGGLTTWERCFLGLPSLTVVVAENQIEATNAVEKAGAVCNLGWYNVADEKIILGSLTMLLHNSQKLKEMSQQAEKIMEGAICVGRNYLVDILLNFKKKR